MGGREFIAKIKDIFGIEPQPEKSKNEAVIELIKKLKLRKIALKEELKQECDVLKREILIDNISILKKQIKKGKDILDD